MKHTLRTHEFCEELKAGNRPCLRNNNSRNIDAYQTWTVFSVAPLKLMIFHTSWRSSQDTRDGFIHLCFWLHPVGFKCCWERQKPSDSHTQSTKLRVVLDESKFPGFIPFRRTVINRPTSEVATDLLSLPLHHGHITGLHLVFLMETTAASFLESSAELIRITEKQAGGLRA